MTRRHDHCPECGVDAGLVCRNMDQTPAVETCEGRPLLPLKRPPRTVNHGVAKSARQALRHCKGEQLPSYAPCTYCGVECKLLGSAVTVGKTTCRSDVCKRQKWRDERKARRQAARKPPRAVECPVCLVTFETTVGTQCYCSTTCRETAKSRRHRNTVTTRTT